MNRSNMNSSITDLQLTTTSLPSPIPDSCGNEELDSADIPGFVAVLMGVVMLCENLLLIIVIGRTKSLHSHTNILVASLAISDVLVSVEVCVMGLYVLPRGLRSWLGLSQAHVRVFNSILTGINFSLVAVSISHFAALAVDRYLYVLWPLHYPLRVTRRRIVAVAAVLWILGLIYMLLPVVLYTSPRYHVKCFLFNSPKEYGTPLLTVYLLCICVVLASTIGLARIALKHRRRKQKRLVGKAKGMSSSRSVNSKEQIIKCSRDGTNCIPKDCGETHTNNTGVNGNGSKSTETHPQINAPKDFTSVKILDGIHPSLTIDKISNTSLRCIDVRGTIDSGAEFKLSNVGTEDHTNGGFNTTPGEIPHVNVGTGELYIQPAQPVLANHDVRAKNELFTVSEHKATVLDNQSTDSEFSTNNLNFLSSTLDKNCIPSSLPNNSDPFSVTKTATSAETPTNNILNTVSSTKDVDDRSSNSLPENPLILSNLAKDTNETTKQAASSRLFSKENIKIIKFVAVMFGCFLVFTFPPLLIFFVNELPGGFDLPDKVIGALFVMLASNSGMNFFIFTHMNREFREAMVQYLSYCRRFATRDRV
ncbi:beta-2 adrenergic receptor [Plakobranchus ocellatus]|uniref:Beta-2 adrenergic receptor n=1 Tax=Plakobranchus ocellatus TaxID=259542 RepID=A0AAV4BK00_9GAST|nr:beta-2 adrenergic receptor [Plakobranchus ocellatus]